MTNRHKLQTCASWVMLVNENISRKDRDGKQIVGLNVGIPQKSCLHSNKSAIRIIKAYL